MGEGTLRCFLSLQMIRYMIWCQNETQNFYRLYFHLYFTPFRYKLYTITYFHEDFILIYTATTFYRNYKEEIINFKVFTVRSE